MKNPNSPLSDFDRATMQNYIVANHPEVWRNEDILKLSDPTLIQLKEETQRIMRQNTPQTFTTRDNLQVTEGETVTLYYCTAFRGPWPITGVVEETHSAHSTIKFGGLYVQDRPELCKPVASLWRSKTQMQADMQATYRQMIECEHTHPSEIEGLEGHQERFETAFAALK